MSRYTSEEAARAEARFYIAAAQRLNLPKNTLMVNDFEDAMMQSNINRNTQAWVDEMRKNGYTNLMFYTSASWLDENNLRKKGPVNTAHFGLQNFWVAQYPSPKLSVNDAKSLRYNGKAGAWQFTSQAELLPGKHLFDHSVDYTGRFTANAKPASDPTEGNLSGKINIVNNDTIAGRFDVVVSNVKAPNGVQAVSVPIWSEIGGQDDIVWYTANRQGNGTYTVNVKAADHRNSTGLYNVHLYYVQNNGQMTGVGGTVTNVFIGKRPEDLKPSGTVTIENNNSSTGTFDAVVRNVVSPTGLKEVLIPSWSVAGGQDDLIWHKATRQSDGSYRATIKASDHKNSVGQYQVHVHYIDQENKRRYVTETIVEVRQSKPQGTLSIENNNSSTGTFDAVVRNVVSPTGLKEVLIPSWSVAGGQDDLIWHKAVRQSDGSYRATIKASDHKNSVGQYQVHVHYLDQNNRRRYVTETIVDVKHNEPVGTISVVNNNKDSGAFDVIISDVYSSKGVHTVQVPIWSEKDGQDDIRWYEAIRQSNGTYKVSVKASDHKFSTGTYHVHLYYIQGDGSQVGVGGTTVQVENRSLTNRNQTTLKHLSTSDTSGQLGRVLKAASSLIGVETGSPEHLKLVRDYNSVHPLPVGYPVKNTDDWCDVFVTTVFQREGLSHLIGRECGVERHIQIFKNLGIWNENGASTPKSGDIITFNWDQNYQQNDGFADHIGIVEYVENGLIHTIEGNSGDVGTVKRNVYRIGNGNIRGFATPRYR